jgi:hypothetical protein
MTKPEKLSERTTLDILPPGTISSLEEIPKERRAFRALLVANPNYFGNLETSPFAPTLTLKGNTTYEEIKCVGFHPQANRLDAVIFLKQPFGYSGNICSGGSPEYVRFYLSFDNGATWVDQGLTGFTAHDVPASATGGNRLEYAVTVPCKPPRKWCSIPNIILARAILSWNSIPPPNAPTFKPVWGNVHDTHIQVDPTWIIKWADLFKLHEIKISAGLAASLDLEQTLTAEPKQPLSLAELHGLYKGEGVDPHRYGLAEIRKLIKTPELTTLPHSLHAYGTLNLDFKLADVIAKLLATDGSTVYEELDCIGLNPNGMNNELVGVLRIKRKNGYSGGPCTAGSREYVTFWADFDNDGTFETCLGTASVRVFDLNVPADGLEYSVNLPVNLNPYRRPCGDGPRVVPIRAILSWNEVPECGNPDWVPVWGNREETLILIPAGNPVIAGDYSPFLYDISNASVCSINQATGLAAGDRPFGGTLCISGEIPAALDETSPDTLEYRLWATQGSTTIPLVEPITIAVEQGSGPGTAISYSITQSVNPDGFFTYREFGTPATGAWRRVSSPNRRLANWNTLGLSGTWTIHIEARRAGTTTPIYAAGTTLCLADGTTRTSVSVTLDQESPVASLTLTGYTDATGFHAALPCGDFTKGVTINGTFDITDNMGVGSFGIALEPIGSVTVVVDPGSTTTHVFGTWSIDTGGLPPCGYVVHLEAYDRTILNCGTSWRDDVTLGFCLRTPS